MTRMIRSRVHVNGPTRFDGKDLEDIVPGIPRDHA